MLNSHAVNLYRIFMRRGGGGRDIKQKFHLYSSISPHMIFSDQSNFICMDGWAYFMIPTNIYIYCGHINSINGVHINICMMLVKKLQSIKQRKWSNSAGEYMWLAGIWAIRGCRAAGRLGGLVWNMRFFCWYKCGLFCAVYIHPFNCAAIEHPV